MTSTTIFEPLKLTRGPAWPNALALAPLTNMQSHPDGTLSDDEFKWLTMRAQGGFGMTMTCAAHVQAIGQGFPGQLGIFGDEHLVGLTRLADAIRAAGSISSVQLHHAGIRAEKSIIANPVGPSAHEETGARALSTDEVKQLRDDFIAAAKRAETAGFDGVEIHGAHGYILCAFLSPELNQREDDYGGSLDNRTRIIREIIAGIRAECRADFQLGLRISPERMGAPLMDNVSFVTDLMTTDDLDYIDLSLWDYTKMPAEEEHQEKTLMGYFTDIPRGSVKLGAAGKIYNAADVRAVFDQGCDFALIGRGAILHHDFPNRVKADADYAMPALPVSRQHLADEGLSETFINYMSGWPGFVEG